jgi:DHA1 family bicyclomycin/chloramphenicol resistance-like MFS transporter
VSIAIVRDRYSGDDMARVLAIVMAVFMIVPAIAPSIGQAALSLGSWRYPFVFSAAFALLLGLWSIRLRETLPPGDRMPLNLRTTVAATREVFRQRRTTGMMIALTFAMGAFFPYLGSGQLIYEQIYDRAGEYPYWFGLAAVCMAAGSVSNSRLIKRIGAEPMLSITMAGYVAVAALFVAVTLATEGTPPFSIFYLLTTALIVVHVMNGALLNSLAMEDVGHVAGTASAVIGTVTTVGGSLLGSVVDRAISDSVVPFALGYLVFGLAMVLSVLLTRPAGSETPHTRAARQRGR